jgi:anti-sigma B factor antagonist
MALSIDVHPGDHHWNVALIGDFDYSECATFRMTIDRILRHTPHATILDLAALDYLDSSGLGLLLSLAKEYGATGGRLVLVTNNAVDSILDLTKLSAIFSTTDSLEAAESMLADTAGGH